jgi:hypothetical protein
VETACWGLTLGLKEPQLSTKGALCGKLCDVLPNLCWGLCSRTLSFPAQKHCARPSQPHFAQPWQNANTGPVTTAYHSEHGCNPCCPSARTHPLTCSTSLSMYTATLVEGAQEGLNRPAKQHGCTPLLPPCSSRHGHAGPPPPTHTHLQHIAVDVHGHVGEVARSLQQLAR